MNNSKIKYSNVDEYIQSFAPEVQVRLTEFRKFIHKTVPGLEETISYGIPTFNLNGKYLIYFAGFKKHIGFYPFPSGIEAFKDQTAEYKTSKGTIQFPHDKPIPWSLVKKIIEFRAQENSKIHLRS